MADPKNGVKDTQVMAYNGVPAVYELNVLSFYRSKMILDHSNCFGLLQIVLVRSKPFWSVQIILVRFKLDFYGLIFITLTWPKWSGPDQNKLDPS